MTPLGRLMGGEKDDDVGGIGGEEKGPAHGMQTA